MMPTIKRINRITIVILLLLTSACVNKNDFEIGPDDWPVGHYGPVSEAAFKLFVVGHGWIGTPTYIMRDGKVTDEEANRMAGFAEYTLYWGEKEQTVFIPYGPHLGFFYRAYEYKTEESSVYYYGIVREMKIVRVGIGSFDAIQHIGYFPDNTRMFGFTTYRMMSASELADVRERFSYDLTSRFPLQYQDE